jgi:tetratricopeptide (TPR) repeat protein
MKETYYDIFGISFSASQDEIRNAYRKLAMIYHPDRNPDKEVAETKMKELNFIYSILSNPDKRRWYNSTIPSYQEYENDNYFYSNVPIYCNQIELIDSKGKKSILKIGDSIYYLVDIDKSIITWKYKSKEYFNLVIKNIFDPQKKEIYSKNVQYDLNKTPLFIVHWGDQGLIIYKEDFESYWISQSSYSLVDKKKGIITGILIILLFFIGIFYFYSKISNSPEYYIKKSKTEYYDKGDYKNALIQLNKAIELNPSNANAFYDRALVKEKLNYYEDAVQDLDKAIKLKPSSIDYYFARIRANYSLGNHAGIIDDCNKITSFDTTAETQAIVYNYRGLVKNQLKNYKGALQDLDRAVELNPSLAVTYNNRGDVKSNLYDYKGAIEDYSKAIEFAPDWFEPYANRGIEKNYLENYKEALDDFNKSIKINPIDAISFEGRGYAKDNLEDFKGAIRDYDKAIEINPSYATAYVHRGYAKLDLKQKHEACIDFKKAADLGDDKAKELLKEYSNE